MSSESTDSTPASAVEPGTTESAPTPADSAGGVLVIGDYAETAESDPATALFDTTWRLHALVYETLITVNSESELLPGIAESWEQPSPTTYLFDLRDGVTFSNGRALSVDDVVGTLERILDPATASYWGPLVGPVASVTALDDDTVEVQLDAPYAPFLASLAHQSAAILPMAELADGSFDPTTQMLGTGPFVLDEHQPDQSRTFSRNPFYWSADSVSLDGVEVRIIPDDATRTAALRDGSIDIAYFNVPDAATLLADVPNVETTVQGSSDMYWLTLNTVNQDAPFTDARVRQAVAYAIDRDRIIELALAGTGLPTSVTSAPLPGACPTESLATYSRDVDRARELLAEAGAEDLSFELVSPPYLPTFSPIAQVIQQSLGEAGIDVSIVTPEFGAYVDSVFIDNPASFDAVVDFWTGYVDPVMAMSYLLSDRNPASAGFFSPDADLAAAFDAAAAPGTLEERSAALLTACEIVVDLSNVIPLATKDNTIGVRTDRVVADVAAFDPYDIYLRDVAGFRMLSE